jgi:HJR/Mrr/RecB family endonuclease
MVECRHRTEGSVHTQRIRDLLVQFDAVTEDLFCTVHRVVDDRLVTLFSSHPNPEVLGSWQPVGRGVVGRAAVERMTACVRDVTGEAEFVSVYPSVRSEVAIPVFSENRDSGDSDLVSYEVSGVVNFESSRVDAFDAELMRTLEGAARVIGFLFMFPETATASEILVPESSLPVPDGDPHSHLILVDTISEAMLARLGQDPSLLHEISPRRFEELIARVLSDLGYGVTLTPPIKDGGFDMFAELSTPTGKILTLVECKRNAARRPVTVEIVRNVYGVLSASKATTAMIATTSRFTRDARSFQDAVGYKMSLRDFGDIANWLKRYKLG